MCEAAGSVKFFNSLTSVKDKTLHLIDHMWHYLPIEEGSDELVSSILSWMAPRAEHHAQRTAALLDEGKRVSEVTEVKASEVSEKEQSEEEATPSTEAIPPDTKSQSGKASEVNTSELSDGKVSEVSEVGAGPTNAKL
eukprot:GHVN01074733.1.p1 GENE.GHVN01074733.1~~GHVN01074733.1.p1  ORF type:complete len:145 (+),score=68.88 GHVN01074733.1:24-437(+)